MIVLLCIQNSKFIHVNNIIGLKVQNVGVLSKLRTRTLINSLELINN